MQGWKHRRKQRCQAESYTGMKPKSVKLMPQNDNINQQFKRNVLSHVRTKNDPAGTLATSNNGCLPLNMSHHLQAARDSPGNFEKQKLIF